MATVVNYKPKEQQIMEAITAAMGGYGQQMNINREQQQREQQLQMIRDQLAQSQNQFQQKQALDQQDLALRTKSQAANEKYNQGMLDLNKASQRSSEINAAMELKQNIMSLPKNARLPAIIAGMQSGRLKMMDGLNLMSAPEPQASPNAQLGTLGALSNLGTPGAARVMQNILGRNISGIFDQPEQGGQPQNPNMPGGQAPQPPMGGPNPAMNGTVDLETGKTYYGADQKSEQPPRPRSRREIEYTEKINLANEKAKELGTKSRTEQYDETMKYISDYRSLANEQLKEKLAELAGESHQYYNMSSLEPERFEAWKRANGITTYGSEVDPSIPPNETRYASKKLIDDVLALRKDKVFGQYIADAFLKVGKKYTDDMSRIILGGKPNQFADYQRIFNKNPEQFVKELIKANPKATTQVYEEAKRMIDVAGPDGINNVDFSKLNDEETKDLWDYYFSLEDPNAPVR